MKGIIVRCIYVLIKIFKKIKYNIMKICLIFYYEKKKNLLDMEYGTAFEIVSTVRKNIFKKNNAIIKKQNVDLSIIIPVYNAEKYLSQCINSIINQELKFKIEIICVNDGSNDNSLEILKSYKDKRIVIVNQVNSGAASARNSGLDIASGKYIMFIDSDDFLPNNSLNNFLSVAFNEDADIVAGNIKKYLSRFDLFVCLKKHKKFTTNNLLKMCNSTEGAPWGKIYRRDLWSKVRFHEGLSFEDCIIFLNIYPQAKKFIYLNRPIYCFRSSDNSLYKRSKRDYSCVDSFWGIENSYLLLDNINISSQHTQLFLWHLSAIMYSRINNIKSMDIKIAIVNLSKKLIFNIISQNNILIDQFTGKNANLYRKILYILDNGTYEEWIYICKIILLSEEI